MTSTALVSSLGRAHVVENQMVKVRRGLFQFLYVFAPGFCALLHLIDIPDDAEFCMPLAAIRCGSNIVNEWAGGPVFAEPTKLSSFTLAN